MELIFFYLYDDGDCCDGDDDDDEFMGRGVMVIGIVITCGDCEYML